MSPAFRWIGIVVGLLVANAIAVGVLIAKSGDPADRIVPDYYRRAVAWDDTVAALRASDELGWSAEAQLVALRPGAARVEIALARDTGAPLTGASVEVEVRHRSRATGTTVTLTERSPGHYDADVALDSHGLHDLGVRARHGADHFAMAQTAELAAAPGAAP